MMKMPSKVAHDRAPTFFLCTGPAAQTAKKQKSRTTKSPLIQDWVFRLGERLKPACVKMVLKIRIFFAAFYPEGSFEKKRDL